jgi:hypothetical protein
MAAHIRFGSQADMCTAIGHVCYQSRRKKSSVAEQHQAAHASATIGKRLDPHQLRQIREVHPGSNDQSSRVRDCDRSECRNSQCRAREGMSGSRHGLDEHVARGPQLGL